jgi:universal stress protein A
MMGVYNHILVATDLSEENNPVIEKAIDLAGCFDSKLSFVHVVEPLPGYGYAYVGVADIESQLIEEAKEAMKTLAAKHNLPADQCHVQVGPTKIEIMGLVKEQEVDCIVLGSHGRHGIAELLGSTAHAVVHGAPCDVVTVRIAKKA